MPAFSVITPDMIREAKTLRTNGFSWPAIARRLNVDQMSLKRKCEISTESTEKSMDLSRARRAARIGRMMANHTMAPITLPSVSFMSRA